MTQELIQCSGVTRWYGSLAALRDLDLTVGRGRIVGLLGPNGSGKTTLIKLLCGLIQPTAGTITIDGEQPGPYTKSIVSYLPDRMYFADWMKTCDLLDFFGVVVKLFGKTDYVAGKLADLVRGFYFGQVTDDNITCFGVFVKTNVLLNCFERPQDDEEHQHKAGKRDLQQ